MVTITTSGAPDAWLDEQGQVESLRELSSRYLFRAFSMKSADYLHIGSIVEGLSQKFIDRYLFDVRERARKVCARLTMERYGSTVLPSVSDS